MNTLLTKIGQLAIFLICAQTLVHFRPKDSYEKYIKLLVSMMLLTLLVEPIMDALGKEKEKDFVERVQMYEQKLQDILISPQLETAQIEVILQNITKQKVEEGTTYVQSQEKQLTTEMDDGEEKQCMQSALETSASSTSAEDVETITVQVEVDTIQKVKIGAGNGKSENNH